MVEEIPLPPPQTWRLIRNSEGGLRIPRFQGKGGREGWGVQLEKSYMSEGGGGGFRLRKVNIVTLLNKKRKLSVIII